MPTSFKADIEAYETWLRGQCAVVEEDLDEKHRKMRKNAFTFLRATYFRWARQIEALCPNLAQAPAVLAVGDAHLENFGTWRDGEGRLVWGVNDFDEATSMSYAFDLLRLATSARLSPKSALQGQPAVAALLDGYVRGLEAPRPTLLDEQETWMRKFVACSDAERAGFWQEVRDYPDADPPAAAQAGLARCFPPGATLVRHARRVKGNGGLGRPRYVGIAIWRGGHIVREAKALVPSAWDWAQGRLAPPSRFSEIGVGAFRSPDPYLSVEDGYIFRRVAADSRKVEFADEAGDDQQIKLIQAMGFDLGAVHAASPAVTAIRLDLQNRPADWLFRAARIAGAAIEADYAAWKA